jgi:phosphonate transport system substrate-binding protein
MLSTHWRCGRSASLTVVVLALLVPVAAVLGGLYVSMVRTPNRENAEINQKSMLHMTGLGDPVTNRLGAAFTDADGDLVADPPTDASKLVDPPTIVFSYIAVEEPEKYKQAWKPFTDYLSKVTGKPVEYLMVEDPKDQLKALRDGKLHVTGLNSGSVPTAVNACGFVPVVMLPSIDGTGMSHMEIIAQAGSSVNSPTELKGHELALTSPGSNSGYKAPLVLLRSDAGLDPGRDYTLVYSGGHDESIDGIASKQYEVAAVASDMIDRAVKQGRLKKGGYKTIFKSERFPTAGLGYLYNLKPELAAKVREALTTFDWKGTSLEAEITVEGQPAKFVPANYKEQWSLIRRIDDTSGTVHEVKD